MSGAVPSEALTQALAEGYTAKKGTLASLTPNDTHYCPGCEHGTITRLIGMALENLGLRERAVMCDSVGCSVLSYNYFNCDHIQCAHGRAPAVGTGIKRANSDLVVFTTQGDGDALAIGMGETVWAAIRGMPLSIFLINNAIYGMTGGQMAPTTLPNQPTTTTPYGRDIEQTGAPLDICKLLATIDNASYVRRVSAIVQPMETRKGTIYSTKNLKQVYTAIENAFKAQLAGKYGFVEILSTCNINWKMPILESKKFGHENLTGTYPLGVYRDDLELEAKA